MENKFIDLRLIQLLSDIVELDHRIQFCGDFSGMLRVEIRKEFDHEYYDHRHIGYPDCDMATLTGFIIEFLEVFYKELQDGIRNSRQ